MSEYQEKHEVGGYHINKCVTILHHLCNKLNMNREMHYHKCRSPDTQPADLAQQPGHNS